MANDPQTVMLRWFEEVWNQGREEVIDELFSSGGITHGLGDGAHVTNRDGFKLFWRNMRTVFPDVQIRVEDMITEGDKAAARLVLTGTHTGEGLGAAKTGSNVSVSAIAMVRVVDGQIVEGWNCWDQLGLMRQIGAPGFEQAPGLG